MSNILIRLGTIETQIENKNMISRRRNSSKMFFPAFALMAGVCHTAAMAQTGPQFDVSCRGGGDIRQILVVAPGEKGDACDVIYTRDRGATATTPYYANSDVNFCINKAVGIRDKLRSANYECSGIGNSILAAATTPSIARSARVEPAAIPAPAVETTASIEPQAIQSGSGASSELASKREDTRDSALSDRDSFLRRLRTADDRPAVSEEEVTNEEAAIESQTKLTNSEALNATVAQVPSVPSPAGSLKDEILIRNQTEIANAGPVKLVLPEANANVTTGGQYSLPAQSRTDVANKFVGATPVVLASAQEGDLVPNNPEETRALTSKTANDVSTSLTNEAPETTALTNSQAAGSGGLLATVAQAVSSEKPRTRPEIIKATLIAQAAAWNEGDIEAFMEGYWRNSDLRFVSGTEVSKGWNNTLKRYKKRYGNGAALGQLMFEELDVQMVTEEVAIVVGRFNLARSSGNSSGAFTLVMKRFEGAWRIIHDHTVADEEQSDAALEE